MANYATATELKYRLGIDDNDRDFALDQVVDAASRWIEVATARRFYATTQTRYYTCEQTWASLANSGYDTQWALERPYAGRSSVVIDDALSVTAVTTDEDGDGVYERTWTVTTDYWLGPRNAAADGKPYRSLNRNVVAGRYFFPAYDGSIAVTGSFGYSAATPAPIRELCLEVGTLMAQPVLDLSVAGVKSYTIGVDLNVTMSEAMLSSTGQTTISAYRQIPL